MGHKERRDDEHPGATGSPDEDLAGGAATVTGDAGREVGSNVGVGAAVARFS